MKELIEYRVAIIERMEQVAREFVEACKSADPFVKAGGDWTVHQIAFHTRDVARLVYGERIHRTLREDNPEFENFDADGWMDAHYDKAEPLEKILDEFQAGVSETCAMLRNLPNEGWSRESRHAAFGGGLSLQLWVERGLAHIEEHLKSLK